MTEAVDRTELFQGLEAEIRQGGSRTASVSERLQEAACDLQDYFEDQGALTRALNVGALTWEHNFLRAKEGTPELAAIVRTLLSEFREARDRGDQSFYRLWAKRMKATTRAIDNAAGVATLQTKSTNFDSPHLVKSYFRDVADLLEGSLQPLIRLRLEIWGLLGRRTNQSPVDSLTFGSVVEELLSSPETMDIYRPPPFRLSASQWRNIASHNTYEVSGSQVTCIYGQSGRQKAFTLSIDALTQTLVFWNDLYYAHKIAVEFFSIDNLAKFREDCTVVSPSEYGQTCTLAFGLIASGFSTMRAESSPGVWLLFLIDERARCNQEVKSSLQEAVRSYLQLSGPIEFRVWVRSDVETYKFGFTAHIVPKNQALLPS